VRQPLAGLADIAFPDCSTPVPDVQAEIADVVLALLEPTTP